MLVFEVFGVSGMCLKCLWVLFQGGETYIYNFDGLGRVTDVILPTGEKLKLSSDLSDNEGLSVKVSAPLQALSKGDKQREIEYEMKNERSKVLTITDGKFEMFSGLENIRLRKRLGYPVANSIITSIFV